MNNYGRSRKEKILKMFGNRSFFSEQTVLFFSQRPCWLMFIFLKQNKMSTKVDWYFKKKKSHFVMYKLPECIVHLSYLLSRCNFYHHPNLFDFLTSCIESLRKIRFCSLWRDELSSKVWLELSSLIFRRFRVQALFLSKRVDLDRYFIQLYLVKLFLFWLGLKS